MVCVIHATLQWQVSGEVKGCLRLEPVRYGSQYCGELSLALCFCLATYLGTFVGQQKF